MKGIEGKCLNEIKNTHLLEAELMNFHFPSTQVIRGKSKATAHGYNARSTHESKVKNIHLS